MAVGDGEIPTTAGIGNLGRILSAPHGLLVADADDVIAEVCQGVAKIPGDIPEFGIGTIPGRGARFVHISKPPDRIDLIVKMNGGQIGAHWHNDAVPFRFWRGGATALRRTFHRKTVRREHHGRHQQQPMPADEIF